MKILNVARVLAFAVFAMALAKAATPTPITTCPYVITSPGDYAVEANLTCPASNGIDVEASNVNLDLNNHIITGGGGYSGISVQPVAPVATLTNIKIQGPGYVRSFGAGLYLANVANSQLQNATLGSNDFAVFASHVNSLQLSGIVAGNSQAAVGIFLGSSTNGMIQLSIVSSVEGAVGIALTSGSGNTIQNNTVSGNSAGIQINGETSDQVQNNIITGNGSNGIALFSTTGTNIHNNVSEANGSYDLYDSTAGCGTNHWYNDIFFTSNQSCVQ